MLPESAQSDGNAVGMGGDSANFNICFTCIKSPIDALFQNISERYIQPKSKLVDKTGRKLL